MPNTATPIVMAIGANISKGSRCGGFLGGRKTGAIGARFKLGVSGVAVSLGR